MRARGSGPKQIAKVLGLRPAQAALVRRVAEAQQAGVGPAGRAVVGCFVNAGWSVGLGMDAAPDWAASDPLHDREGLGTGGFAQILLARRERASRVTVCGFLVDVYCLGVKNVTGPEVMGAGSFQAYARSYYSAFDHPPLSIGVEQAQAIVHGAVAYARALGFDWGGDDLDQLSRYDGLLALRLNPLGAYATGRAPAYIPAPAPVDTDCRGIKVLPNFDIVALDGLHPADALLLDAFADKTSDRGVDPERRLPPERPGHPAHPEGAPLLPCPGVRAAAAANCRHPAGRHRTPPRQGPRRRPGPPRRVRRQSPGCSSCGRPRADRG